MKKAILFFALFFAVWEFASATFDHLQFVLPRPSQIFTVSLEHNRRLFFHTVVTLKEMLGGFFCAALLSFPLAWAMMQYKTTRTLLQPFFVVVQALPMFVLAPLMVIWFGFGQAAIIIPTTLMIFFPLTINIYQGLISTPAPLLEFFQTSGATPFQTFTKLRLPAALPHIFAGLRIASAIAAMGAIAGEWAGGQNGLGILMLESRRNIDLEITFGALFLVMILSLIFYGFVILLEKRLLKFPRGAVVALCLLFLTGCCEKKETTKLMLDWIPSATHVPLYAGLEKGFFAEEGIELEILKMHESGGGLSFLTSGCADLLVTHMPSALRACSKGAKIKMVGVMIKEPLSCLLYHKDHKVESPKDLSNLIFGYCLGDCDFAFVNYLFQTGKTAPKESLHVGCDLISAIATKRIDFLFGTFWNVEPHQFRALGVETGYLKLADFGVPPYYELIIVGKEKNEPFQRALQKSLDFCRDHPQEAFNCYIHLNCDKSEKTIAWEKKAWLETVPILAQDQSCDKQIFDTFCSWLQEREFISKDQDYKNLFVP